MQSISILVLFVLTLSGSTCARDVKLNRSWKIWKNQFNKNYSNAEEHLRRVIWEKNLKIVEEHNRQADLGIYTYWLGMNQFADLNIEEFAKLFNNLNSKKEESNSDNAIFTVNSNINLPDTVDWRTKGAVTPVKNQGQCGSSWAFSAIGSIEGLYAIKTGKLIPLSEQQLVDCTVTYGNMGCSGGYMSTSFQYIQDAGGLQDNKTYPYNAHDNKCTFDKSKAVVQLCGYVNITSGSEAALQQAIATVGPVATAVDAGHTSFQLYKSGVYDEPNCSHTQPDHGIFVVGYGNESGKDYWLLKNSWDTTWGEQGYIKLIRNKNNQCAIASIASFPVIC